MSRKEKYNINKLFKNITILTRSIADDCRLKSVPFASKISEPKPDSML
jgi:hypothetical protein